MAELGGLEIMTLSEEEQLTLLGVMLRLMDRSLAELKKGRAKTQEKVPIRESRRNQLRALRWKAVTGSISHEALEVEDVAILRDRLAAVSSEATALQLIVEASAWQPWIEGMPDGTDGRLPSDARREVLKWASHHMPGRIKKEQLDHVDRLIYGMSPARRRVLIGAAVGVGAAAGVATAGLAAPAIGTALGGAMGLSGAAATSAGLAALGGGSLAAGGLGMAGGTAVIGALGGVGGAGLGASFAAAGTKPDDDDDPPALVLEQRKFRALVTVGDELTETTRRRTASQGTIIEQNVAELISQRSIATLERRTSSAGELSTEIRRNVDLRRSLKTMPKFELD